MNIAVVGTGYVGVVTAACFAKLGNKVTGLDIEKAKIDQLKKGKIPFYEPGLGKLVKENLKSGNLIFTTSFAKAIPEAKVIFICVGTPPKRNGDYNLNYVLKAAHSIANHLKNYAVVAIKSTVPPGTNQIVREQMKKKNPLGFDLASCPEFLREGNAINDFLRPSRVVIGAQSRQAIKILKTLHQPLKAPMVISDANSAQMVKYAANAFLATKISFINAIAILCDRVGADITKVSEGLGLDPRIGRQFLNAGLGYGGSCFPKDTWALISFAKKRGYDFGFLKQVDEINKKQIDYFVEKIIKVFSGDLKDKKLAILGLSFKPNTDDIRFARSIPLIEKLQKLGAKIIAYDPQAMKNAKKILKNVLYGQDVYDILKGGDALILVTEWEEFKELDFNKVKKLMRQPTIFDGRNIYDPKKLKRLGFKYTGVGRK